MKITTAAPTPPVTTVEFDPTNRTDVLRLFSSAINQAARTTVSDKFGLAMEYRDYLMGEPYQLPTEPGRYRDCDGDLVTLTEDGEWTRGGYPTTVHDVATYSPLYKEAP